MPISKDTLEFRKNNNLCEKCGKLNAPDKKLCRKHLDAAAVRTQKTRTKRKQQNLCEFCGQNPRHNNSNLCKDCKTKVKSRSKKYNSTRYIKRKKENKCIMCGNQLDRDGIRCIKCTNIDNQRMKNMRDKRKSQGICPICGQNPLGQDNVAYCDECSQKRSEWYATSETRIKNKQRFDNERNQVFNYYGNQCSCCGENILDFLEIDHINADGNKHRKQINKYGSQFYRWLIDNNFPDGFRTLCSNCNKARYKNNGVCPHENQKDKS